MEEEGMQTLSRVEWKQVHKKAVILWGGILATLFIYAALVKILEMKPNFLSSTSDFLDTEKIKYIFLGISLILFLLISTIRRVILEGRPGMFEARGKTGGFPERASKLLTASMVINAFCEMPAIFGLVLFFISGKPYDFFMFWILSLIGLVFSFPRSGQWEEYLEEFESRG